ncbi:MAG: bifunctional [glutamine synthetase] adenylyltransferase/[glutamine synthetase]-adenylyl-L-tyrosine phosphorylase [Rhodobacteraceae bacterium]|nr:bifunctional [glutamine synthetase] adenylyltransferase/[glutamine synthetase]-adenylyl-L-tyrosine phosphorylase [Paracoccaceae bacterium]
MALKDLLKTAPIPFEPELTQEVLAKLGLAEGHAKELVAGIAGCSPYLRGLLMREADWFAGALNLEPEEVFTAILASTGAQAPQELSIQLRIAKRRVALLLAVCDLGGVWSLEQITRRLTEFADFATQAALQSQIRREQARGKLPGVSVEDVADCAGIVVLAMGKMGAYELNYSSDIDLIVLFDETRHTEENYYDVRAGFLRATRNMTKMLSDITADGYVFRTDLRLRPNPSVTPVCVPMDGAEAYYESEGRTWERAAFIKARVCAGDIEAGNRFLERIRPFVWRRHLDFVAIQDAHDMRQRIREHKGLGGEIVVLGHDLKLGRGGIREIEFFAQTQQLIAGGRDKNLRSSRTDEALRALAAKEWLPSDLAQQLIAAYRAHRDIEHRIQMLRDAQTHKMPANAAEMDRLARLCGWADTGAFMEDVRARLGHVHFATESFFAPDEKEELTPDAAELPADLMQIMDSWAGLPALRSPRAVTIFDRLRPDLINRLAKTTRPGETLAQLDGFVRGLPAGVQLFSMFEANPHILDLLIDICATAPSLAQYLSRNTGVFDAVLSGRFFDPLPSSKQMSEQLAGVLQDTCDYEEALNGTRRWFKEMHFRIGVLVLRKLAPLEEAERAYADLAEAVLQQVLPLVQRDFARRYGVFDSQQMSVLAMGKLGSRQMTATSDLDLIVVYRAVGEVSDGRRGLAQSAYFSRLTQALITALTSPMAEGMLYEVDMRLRPSGRAGTVATSLAGFETYQFTKAWTWEHLALTRGRVIAGDVALAEALEKLRRDVLAETRDPESVRKDVRDMRNRLAVAKTATAGDWDVKDRAGGILDIELLAQMFSLLGKKTSGEPDQQLQDAVAEGLLGREDCEQLSRTHRFLCSFQQAHRLLMEGRFDPEKLGAEGMDFVIRIAGCENAEALKSEIQVQTGVAEQIIVRNLS